MAHLRRGYVASLLLPMHGQQNTPEDFAVNQHGIQDSRFFIRELRIRSRLDESLKSFFSFLLEEAPSKNLLVFTDDENMREIFPLLPILWSDFSSDLTFWTFNGTLTKSEPFLKSFNHESRIKNVLVLLNPISAINLFKEVGRLSLESPSLRWLVIGDKSLLSPLLEVIREGTQITISTGHLQEKIDIFTSFIDKENAPRFRKFKSWQQCEDGQIKIKIEGPVRKDPLQEYEDFGGRALLIATLRNIPFLDLVPDGEFVTPVGGIEYHMLEIIKKRLNFTCKMKLPSDGQWGEVFQNGSATGIVGMVARRDTDFCLGELTIMGAREKVVDFSQPYFTESTTLVTRAPKKKSQAFALVIPFTLETWIFLICAMLTMGVLLLIFSLSMKDFEHLTLAHRWCDFQFGVYRAMLYKDSHLKFKNGPMRMASGCWYLFSNFIFIVYSNMLIASIIVPQYEKPIDSLVDLLEATREGAIMMVNPGSSFEFIFKRAEDGIYKDIWMNFNPSLGYVSDSRTGVEEVLKSWKVFVTAEMKSRVLTTIMGKNKFNIARNTFYPQSYGMAFRSGAPYQRQFNNMILKLTQAGFINKWTADELSSLERKSAFIPTKMETDKVRNEKPDEGNNLEAFSLSHLQAAFYLVAFGYILATIVFLLELLNKRIF